MKAVSVTFESEHCKIIFNTQLCTIPDERVLVGKEYVVVLVDWVELKEPHKPTAGTMTILVSINKNIYCRIYNLFSKHSITFCF